MVVIKQKHLLGSCILRNGFRKAHLIPNILYTTQKNRSNFVHYKSSPFMMPIF